MTIHGEGKIWQRRLGEKQQDAIQAQRVNIEFPSTCIDKSSNKEVSECSEKGFSLTLSDYVLLTGNRRYSKTH